MQPSDKGGRFPQILDLFQGLKIGVCGGSVAVWGKHWVTLSFAETKVDI